MIDWADTGCAGSQAPETGKVFVFRKNKRTHHEEHEEKQSF